MPPRPLTAPQDAIDLLVAHNQARAREGKPALRLSLRLIAAAQAHASWMAANSRMSHEGAAGSSVAGRVTAQGYAWRSCAENVACGQGSVAEVVTGWLNSPGHRQNVLGNFLDSGYAYAVARDGL